MATCSREQISYLKNFKKGQKKTNKKKTKISVSFGTIVGNIYRNPITRETGFSDHSAITFFFSETIFFIINFP